MKTFYVMYDPHCGLCTEVRDWLGKQLAYVNLRLLASDSEVVRRNFPNLPPGELSVVSESGEVWLGDRAFILCLWCLRGYRGWARKLASPILLPMARQAFETLSRNRAGVSALLHLKNESELKQHLSKVSIPSCRIK